MLNTKSIAKWSLKVGRVWRIDVRVHVLFPACIGLWLIFTNDLQADLAFLGCLLLSVFLHELGHCWGARRVGGEAKEIVLWPLGGLADLNAPSNSRAEFIYTAAGPAMNLLLALLGLSLLVAIGWRPGSSDELLALVTGEGWRLRGTAQLILRALTLVNLLLLVVNVLPAYPMDGGRLLRALLWRPLGWRTATLIAAGLAFCLGVGLLALAVWLRDGLLVLVGGFVAVYSLDELLRAKAFRPLPTGDDDLMPHERRQR